VAALIVLVNTDSRTRRILQDQLSERGCLVAAVASFAEARHLVDSSSPDVLVTGVRLGAYNGLHLAIRSRLNDPDLPVIVTHSTFDADAEAIARQYGATFIADPLDNPEFLKSVHKCVQQRLGARRPMRRWLRRTTSTPVDVNCHQVRGRLLDVSYGGARVALDQQCDLPSMFEVFAPGTGLRVQAQRVWTTRSADSLMCGVAVLDGAADHWRRFVDAVAPSGAA
jgi:DNA-binding response OmpR family regulator